MKRSLKKGLFIIVSLVACLFMYQSARANTTADLESLLIGEIKDMVIVDPASAAPTAAFQDQNGVSHTLAEFQDRVVIVNFWATWCPPCIEEMPALDRLSQTLDPKEAVVLTISLDSGENLERAHKISEFFNKQNIKSLRSYFDQDQSLYQAFMPRGLPSTFIIDAKGLLRAKLDGPVKWDSDEAVAFIKALIDQEK